MVHEASGPPRDIVLAGAALEQQFPARAIPVGLGALHLPRSVVKSS
jgi:hypothetical protein